MKKITQFEATIVVPLYVIEGWLIVSSASKRISTLFQPVPNVCPTPKLKSPIKFKYD